MKHFFTIWGGLPQNFKVIKAPLISFPGNHLFAHHCIIQYLIIIFLKLPSLRRYNSYLSKPSHTGQSCCSIYSVRHDCHLQFNNIIDKVWPVFCFFLKKELFSVLPAGIMVTSKVAEDLALRKCIQLCAISIFTHMFPAGQQLYCFSLSKEEQSDSAFFLYTDLSIKRIIHRKTG